MSTISWGYSKITHFSLFRSNLCVVMAALLGSLVYSLIARLDSFSFSLIMFALSFGIFNVVQIAGGVLIQNRLKKENRIIITKYVSFCSRIGKTASLIVLHWLSANKYGVSGVYKLYGALAILAFCLYLGWMAMQKNSEKKLIHERIFDGKGS